MITALFVILVIAALVSYHLLVQRPREAKTPAERYLPAPISLSEALEEIPEGVALHPTFTWARTRVDGELLVGVHPILLGLMGLPREMDLLPEGWKVEKGAPLLTLQQGDRELRVFSPVAGTVLESNPVLAPERGWKATGLQGGSWIYRIEPARDPQEVPAWLLGARAREWTHDRYRQIRDYIFRSVPDREVGVALADGGELPTGVLGLLDGAAWDGFQDRFLSPGEGNEE